MASRPKHVQSVAFVSLGCPKNLVDSERMLGLLAGDGIALEPNPERADAIVINTCGFLEASKEESLKEIRDAIALKGKGRVKRVVVAGCLVQRHKSRLLTDAPGIDRLVGVFDRDHIVDAVRGKENPREEHGHYLGKYHNLSERLSDEATKRQSDEGKALRQRGSKAVRGKITADDDVRGPQSQIANRKSQTPLPVFEDDRARFRLTPRHYAYLRISEGCNQGCAFCTIPSIRGPMRSKPPEQILAEARELAADGAIELNLIGQDTTSYGTDIGYGPGLAGLLKLLDRELKDVAWLRLMYAYPTCFSDEMIATIGECERVVKYIDMPLQHINDRILGQMKRRVTRKQIETLLGKLRGVPNMAIRTTFIAGSPGETDAEHRELLDFVKDFRFDMMGVFAFSPEPGTPMGRATGQLPDAVKQQWVEALMLAQQEIAFERAKGQVGIAMSVLIDRPAGRDAGDGYVARSQGQAPEIDSVVYVHGKDLHPGQIVDVKVTDYQAYDLVAEVPMKKGRALKVLASS